MSEQSQNFPKPANRSANKPIYIGLVRDPETDGINYYKIDDFNLYNGYLSVKGFELTKAQANRLRENINATIAYKVPVDLIIPWQQLLRIENLTYSQKRMEIKNAK